MIDVSVVLITWSPTPARFKVMKRSLKSLRACTKIPYKLVIVDNGPEVQSTFLKSQPCHTIIQPGVNVGVGVARNLGAEATDSEYIAFVDNDLLYFPKWLKSGVNVLKRLSKWPLIASPSGYYPQKCKQYCVGNLNDYLLYRRMSGQCLIMRRKDFNIIGPWDDSSVPGGNYSIRARKHQYYFVCHPNWNVQHLCRKPSYDHKKQLVNGEWI